MKTALNTQDVANIDPTATNPQDYADGNLYNICPSCGRIFRSKGRKFGHIFCRECDERHAQTAKEHGM